MGNARWLVTAWHIVCLIFRRVGIRKLRSGIPETSLCGSRATRSKQLEVEAATNSKARRAKRMTMRGFCSLLRFFQFV